MNWVASGNETGEVHGEVAVESGTQRIVSVADRHRERSSGRCRDDCAQFPSTGQCRYKPGAILDRWKVPHESPSHHLADVEVARAQPGGLYKHQRYGDGIQIRVAGDTTERF